MPGMEQEEFGLYFRLACKIWISLFDLLILFNTC